MTKVLLQYGSPASDGSYPPVEGVLIWTPTRRRVVAGMPDKIIMPIGFKVPITGGVITVNVAPSGIDWVWRVDELVKGMSRVISYKAVPDQEEIDFTELVSVNPLSLSPLAEPEPIWYPWAEALAETTAKAQQNAEDAQLAATESQDSAAASATAAAGSAAEASGYVTQAGGHANYAGSSAFSAGDSMFKAKASENAAAASALAASTSESNAALFKNAAETAQAYSEEARDASINARTGSESARDQSIALRDEAIAARNATVTDGLVDPNGHLILTRDDLSVTDAGYVVGPPINLEVVGTTTSATSEVVVGPQGPIGPKGDPGGWVVTVLTAGTNLDTVVAPGLYLNPNVNAAAGPSNTAGYGGHLEVIGSSGWFVQRYTNIFETREVYIRYRNSSSTWGPWRPYNSVRVDQSAGRTIYMWDDVNNRDQLIYGDTGWRDITSLLLNGWDTASANKLYLRRDGNQVFLQGRMTIASGNAAVAHNTLFYTLPTGFVPDFGVAALTTVIRSGAASLCRTGTSSSGLYHYTLSGIAGQVSDFQAGDVLNIQTSWATAQAWPSTLPGVASGSIPNA